METKLLCIMVQTILITNSEPEGEVVLGSFFIRSCQTVDQLTVKKKTKSKDTVANSKRPRQDRDIKRCFRRVLPPKRVPHEIATNQQDKKLPTNNFLL